MPIQTNCSNCGRALRVPDELLGRQVKCPSCGTIFTATAEAGQPLPPSAAPPPPPPRPQPVGGYSEAPDAGEEFGREPREPGWRRRAKDAVRVPAILLLVTGILNIIGAAYFIVNGLFVMSNPQQAAQFQAQMQGQNPNAPDVLKIVQASGAAYLIFGILDIPLAGLIIFGAVRMLGAKSLGLARTASVLSMVPCISPCCILGLVGGIWSLVVLANPDVQRAFR